ncbi:FeoA domain-containing protein [Treponema sp. OMZ 840]|uniref:FeoA family protein n=1 Tax=Treponema sp. OMZ 840 TaxID=244313 RepID=UPI003D8B9E26
MPLAMVSCGEVRTIRNFCGGEDIKQHLLDIGLIPGEIVQVIGENASGLILKVKGVRLALNRGLAQKIIVY